MHLEYADWPEAARALALNRPWRICDVSRDLHALDGLGESAEGPEILFAKLGAKSWRDGGRLHPLPRDALLKQRLVRMLRALTPQQRTIVRQIEEAGAPVRLYLFPWIDMSVWSEARVLVRGDDASVSSWRGTMTDAQRAEVIALAAKSAGHLFRAEPRRSVDVDVAFAEGRECRLVEFNPVGARA